MPLIALLLALSCGGADPCEGEGRDACLAERAVREVAEDPAAALASARAIEDLAVRELALVRVLTHPGAFRDDALRAACEAELSLAAHKDQCRRYRERPHLRTEAAPGAGAPMTSLPPGTDCATATGEAADLCAYTRALELREAEVPALRAVLEAMGSPELRGQAVTGVLRQRRQVADLAELEALRGLVALAPEGRWRDEAASLAGAELPFRLLDACRVTPSRPGCPVDEAAALGPSFATCEAAGALREQCFDHICMNGVRGALDQGMADAPPDLAARVQVRHAGLVALDPRVEAMPGCQGVWLGRKLAQRMAADPAAATARCEALGGPVTDACLSGFAEEWLTTWLRQNDVADIDELITRAIERPSDFGDLPPAAAAFLPCGALSLLTGELSTRLAGRRPNPQQIGRLHAASPRCAWR